MRAVLLLAIVVAVLGAASTSAGRWRTRARARARLVDPSTGTGRAGPGSSRLHVDRAVDQVRRWWGTTGEQRQLERALPDALESVAGAVRSGRSLTDGLAEAARESSGLLGVDLGAVSRRLDQGDSIVAALASWAERRPLPTVQLAVAGLQLAAELGGTQGTVLDDVAATVRDRVAAHDDLRAAATQARASAAVLAVAPVGFALFSGVVDPHTLGTTLASPVGAACLVGGITLDLAGAWWMLRLSGGRG